MVYVTTCHHPRVGQGFLAAVDMNSGRSRWTVKLRGFAWSSPIVGPISDRESAKSGEGSNSSFAVLACDSTGAVFVRDAMTGKSLLTDSAGKTIRCIQLGANVESSPIVWKGRVYVGVRGGALLCLGLPKDK
jgi:outer membrane protein assembly factor BamB